MRTLVTGGAGFIGSHLAEHLIGLGHNVVVLDDLSRGQLQNLEPVISHPQFKFIQADVSQYDVIAKHFENIDWVFHLAALADIVPSIDDPITYHRANVDGTVAVLEASRRNGIKRFIYTASASCYGLATEFPTPESAPIRPEYPYALTKFLGEHCALHWGQIYKLPVLSLRLANVYGLRARTKGAYGAVFGVFLSQKYHGQPFTIVGDGTQSRDFTFVSDVVAAFMAAAQSNLQQEILNVGSGGTYSINNLVELLGGEKIHIPKRPGEPDCTHSDITKIQSLLSWHPCVSFEKGVSIMLQHLHDFKKAPVWTKESIEKATQNWFHYLGRG